MVRSVALPSTPNDRPFIGPIDWTLLEGVAIVRRRSGIIPEKLWAEHLEFVTQEPVKAIIVLVEGSPTLDLNQRKQLADSMQRNCVVATVITDSVLARGMITALSWLGSDIKTYSWRNLSQALDSLQSSPALRAEIFCRARALLSKKELSVA